MRELTKILKVLSDESRLRVLNLIIDNNGVGLNIKFEVAGGVIGSEGPGRLMLKGYKINIIIGDGI